MGVAHRLVPVRKAVFARRWMPMQMIAMRAVMEVCVLMHPRVVVMLVAA